MDRKQLKRFIDKVDFRITGCWEWMAYRDKDGYGMFKVKGKMKRAHRVSYEHFVGVIPPKPYEIDHKCKVTCCVRPDHLEVVLHRENIMRGDLPQVTRERCAAITHCPRGHEYTAMNTRIERNEKGYRTRKCRRCQRMRDRRRFRGMIWGRGIRREEGAQLLLL